MRRLALGFSLVALLGMAACSGKKPIVEPVYKPGATNTFRTEGKDEQACFKHAREHCKGDFEVLKRDSKEDGSEGEVQTLEFRCI